MGKLFGTNGVRGITNKDLTPELALKLGKAIGTFFGEGKKVLIGRDARAGGEMIMRAVESGMLACGVKIYEAGCVPTPALQYCIRKFGYDGGIMITASHNPREFNGIKVIEKDGIEAENRSEESIEKHFFADRFSVVDWKKLNYDVEREDRTIKEYVDGILKLVDAKKIAKRRLKVLVDGANSVGSTTTLMVAKALGCEIYEINTNFDPLFPARNPEPNHDTLSATSELAKAKGVDFAVAHDGDADRAVFIDSKGRIQHGDRSGALLAAFVSGKVKDAPKRIFTPLSSSNLVEEYLSKYGIETRWTKIGSRFVARALAKEGGIAGFEDNGGFIFPAHQYVRDGAMAFALMAEMLASEKRSSAELFDALPVYHTSKIKVPWNPKADVSDVLSRVTEAYKGQGSVADTDDDGIKFSGRGFWFIVRKSGTEPVIRISVETKEGKALAPIMENLKKLVG